MSELSFQILSDPLQIFEIARELVVGIFKTCDDIWFLSSLAVKEIEDLLRVRPNHAELRLIKYDGQIHREVLSRNAG